MNTPASLLLAIAIGFALTGCDQRRQPTDSKGGNGSDSFVFDPEAAQQKTVDTKVRPTGSVMPEKKNQEPKK